MTNDGETRDEARPIEHLVGSVLTSIVKAQGLAAHQLVEMIDTIGFEPAVKGEPRATRNFSFDYFRNDLNETTQKIERRRVTATVPLLTLINLPTIAIDEARVQMELRLVAQRQAESSTEEGPRPLELFAVPAKKQLVRSASEAFAVDSAGTIKIDVTMRQQAPMGLEKVRQMLDGGGEELTRLEEPKLPPTPPASDEPERGLDEPTPLEGES